MGLLDKMEEKANEKERQRGARDMNNLFVYLESCDVEGLDEVLSKIKSLKDSGYYVKLIESYKLECNIPKNRIFTVDELFLVRIIKFADEYLRHGSFIYKMVTNIRFSYWMSANQVLSVYSFIEFTYGIFIGKPTNFDDSLNMYFSRLDERIIFALDHFDEVELEELPEPTSEYFQALNKLKWKNKNTKKLYKKLIRLMFEIMEYSLDYSDRISEYLKDLSSYRSTEDLFIQTLAGFSAVNDGRLEIEEKDVVIAYKTFFKLIKTDVTKYKAIPELVQGIDIIQEG